MITLRKYKIKAIQVDLGIFTHIPGYSDIFRHIWPYLRTFQAYSQSCTILAYSEPFFFQNPGIFTTSAYLEPEAHSKPLYIQNPMHIQNPDKHL